MGSGCGGWLAQVLADQGHLLPGEGAVPALVAGSGEGFDQGVATGYPACEVAHGGGGRWHRENTAGRVLVCSWLLNCFFVNA